VAITLVDLPEGHIKIFDLFWEKKVFLLDGTISMYAAESWAW
jgi:hypothetical protein